MLARVGGKRGCVGWVVIIGGGGITPYAAVNNLYRNIRTPEDGHGHFLAFSVLQLFLMKNMFNVTTVLPHNFLQTNPCILHNFSTQVFRKCSAAQGPRSEVVPRTF